MLYDCIIKSRFRQGSGLLIVGIVYVQRIEELFGGGVFREKIKEATLLGCLFFRIDGL